MNSRSNIEQLVPGSLFVDCVVAESCLVLCVIVSQSTHLSDKIYYLLTSTNLDGSVSSFVNWKTRQTFLSWIENGFITNVYGDTPGIDHESMES